MTEKEAYIKIQSDGTWGVDLYSAAFELAHGRKPSADERAAIKLRLLSEAYGVSNG